jgi:hypothetical protein
MPAIQLDGQGFNVRFQTSSASLHSRIDDDTDGILQAIIRECMSQAVANIQRAIDLHTQDGDGQTARP